MGIAERKHPAILLLEDALRASASPAAGATWERERRRAFAPPARDEGTAKCMLRPRRDARAQTRAEADQERRSRRRTRPDLRARQDRRRLHCSRCATAVGRTRVGPNRGRSASENDGERNLMVVALTNSSAATALPWFANGAFPLYLAPMAGVSDKIF